MKPVLDDAKRAAICGVLSIGGTRRMAARLVGCTPNTIRNTANRDPAFRLQLDQTQVSPEITYLKTVFNAGKEHWAAAKWALQHIYPDRYSRQPRTMAVADVKDLISQLLATIAKVIPDSKTRAAVRRRVRKITDTAIRKSTRRPRRAK